MSDRQVISFPITNEAVGQARQAIPRLKRAAMTEVDLVLGKVEKLEVRNYHFSIKAAGPDHLIGEFQS